MEPQCVNQIVLVLYLAGFVQEEVQLPQALALVYVEIHLHLELNNVMMAILLL